jgi:hypothetical protein
MSDEAPGAGGRRTLLAGVVAVGLAAAAAVAAISTSHGPDDPGTTVPTTLAGTRSRKIEHTFTPTHTGQVWITLTSTGGSGRDVELAWGPWRRMFPTRPAAAVTYWFEKKDVSSLPLTVEVPDDVEIGFGEGDPPVGSVDARPGWTKRSPSGAEVPPAT